MRPKKERQTIEKSIPVIIAAVMIFFFFSGCEDTGNSSGGGSSSTDGKVTVNLTNAAPVDGDTFAAFLYAKDEHSLNTESKVKALNYTTVASGEASFVLEEEDTGNDWSPNGTEWTGSGGVTYDLFIYTDNDNDSDGEAANSTRAYRTDPVMTEVAIDGDQTVNIDFTDMVDYDGGTLTVSITGAGDKDGEVFSVGVFLNGADSDNDDYLASGGEAISGGNASVTVDYPDGAGGGTFYGIDTLMYDVYIFINEDANEEPTTGEMIYDTFPYTYTQSGNDNETITTDYSDYSVIP